MAAWTRNEEARLLELAAAGVLLNEIAARTGRTRASVASKLRKLRPLGIVRRPRGALQAEVRRLHALGYNDLEIARELNVTGEVVWNARTRCGLPPNAKRGRPRKVLV